MANALRVYIETSVWGMTAPGQDRVLRGQTLQFLQQCTEGLFLPYSSSVVVEEIQRAPPRTREAILRRFEEIGPSELPLPPEVDALAKRFLEEGIVPEKRYDDARHVACAMVNDMDVLVSWDHRHIVNVRKVHSFREVAALAGYAARLEICTPREIMQ